MISLDKLQELSVFNGFTKEEIDLIVDCSTEKEFTVDSIVVEESAKSSDLYLILSGRVSVEMEIISSISTEHTERLSIIKEGEVFGELSFIEGTLRSAQIRAIDNVKVLVVNAVEANKIFEENHLLGFKMMKNLAIVVCERLKETNLMWRNIATNYM